MMTVRLRTAERGPTDAQPPATAPGMARVWFLRPANSLNGNLRINRPQREFNPATLNEIKRSPISEGVRRKGEMKVGIIGAGAVGSACLTAMVARGCAREIVV